MSEKITENRSSCCAPTEGSGINRRDFLKTSSAAMALMMAGRVEAMAGPFLPEDFNQIIPANKKLTASWINSLYQRGSPLSVNNQTANYIGMPINGLGTGQVYLSADGQLWYWNLTAEKGGKNNPKGHAYMQPYQVPQSANEGFAVKVDDKIFPLNSSGFSDVTFTNQYPMGLVEYTDNNCPIKIELEAYTPFIPLNRDESSYPVVVMRYTLTNTSKMPKQLALAGWIENNKNAQTHQKVNTFQKLKGLSAVECSAETSDANSIALGLFAHSAADFVQLNKTTNQPEDMFVEVEEAELNKVITSGDNKLYASLGTSLTLNSGESKTISFAVSWRVPNLRYGTAFGVGKNSTSPGKYHYASLINSAAMASSMVANNEQALYGKTKQWVDTWYDSSLPYWFLERTFIPINCMQTQTAQRVYPQGESTDIYNLEEGVRCCPGNCTHVWNYAQGLARVFPEIERECRDRIEYGKGFNSQTGMIYFRYSMQDGKKGRDDELDGTCGTIIRVLRESQMTTDYGFLQHLWPRVKKSMEFVIKEWDADEDGILSGAQHNTLDEPWYGKVHWLINVYHAALQSAANMAQQMSEPELASRYENIVKKGAQTMVEQLWREDFGYFVHIPPDNETQMHGSTNGCHIDQVLGESWLHEVGLPPILPEDKTKKALQALWKYNFAPDVGAFRDVMKEGRWYAAPGEAGLVMCSFPNGKVEPKSGNKNYAGYLNECMTGFEWQVAAHMLRLGMIEEGLAIGKAIYDRYSPHVRNPYNEVECSDHYSRAMASYSAYLAACGYKYDGPQASLAFNPCIQPENFKGAFTCAEGWGQFRQQLRHGQLELRELSLGQLKAGNVNKVKLSLNGENLNVSALFKNQQIIIRFYQPVVITQTQVMKVEAW